MVNCFLRIDESNFCDFNIIDGFVWNCDILTILEIVGTFNPAVADKLEKYKTSLKDKVMRSVDELKRGDRELD